MKHKSLFVRHLHFTRSRGETNLASPRAEVPRNSLIINDTRRAVICIIEWHLQQDRQERATSAKTSRIGKNEQLRQKQAGSARTNIFGKSKQDRQERANSAKASRIGKNEQLRQKQAGLVRAPRSLARQKRKIYLCSLKIEGVPDERNRGGDASS